MFALRDYLPSNTGGDRDTPPRIDRCMQFGDTLRPSVGSIRRDTVRMWRKRERTTTMTASSTWILLWYSFGTSNDDGDDTTKRSVTTIRRTHARDWTRTDDELRRLPLLLVRRRRRRRSKQSKYNRYKAKTKNRFLLYLQERLFGRESNGNVCPP